MEGEGEKSEGEEISPAFSPPGSPSPAQALYNFGEAGSDRGGVGGRGGGEGDWSRI